MHKSHCAHVLRTRTSLFQTTRVSGRCVSVVTLESKDLIGHGRNNVLTYVVAGHTLHSLTLWLFSLAIGLEGQAYCVVTIKAENELIRCYASHTIL